MEGGSEKSNIIMNILIILELVIVYNPFTGKEVTVHENFLDSFYI